MSNNSTDNISHDDHHFATTPAEQDAEDYIKHFESVENKWHILQNIVFSLRNQPDQDSRISVIIKFIETQQKWNEEVYELLVKMNNFFAPK